jgi:density-regulated protein DRP1
MSHEEDDEGHAVALMEPKVIEYCPISGFPLEFTEYHPKWEQCAKHLKTVAPELLEKLRALRISSGREKPAEAAPAKVPKADGEADGEGDAEGDDEEDGADGEGDDEDDEEEAAPAPVKKTDKKEVIVTAKDRTRRKHITIVAGLESVGLKPKDVAKIFSKKFATSASVTKEVRMRRHALTQHHPSAPAAV